MGVMMKGDKDLLTLRIHAGGPLNGITVTADSKGNVKGYVGNPDVVIPANKKGNLTWQVLSASDSWMSSKTGTERAVRRTVRSADE